MSYSIRNWSLYAPYAYTDVEIEDPAATEVAESADGVTLDLGLVGDSDVTVWVPRYSGYAAGDSVVVSWEGRTAAGQSLSRQSAPFVFEFFVPNASDAISDNVRSRG